MEEKSREERMFKSYHARKRRKSKKDILDTIEKRAHADVKNLKKKLKKIKNRHHDGK